MKKEIAYLRQKIEVNFDGVHTDEGFTLQEMISSLLKIVEKLDARITELERVDFDSLPPGSRFTVHDDTVYIKGENGSWWRQDFDTFPHNQYTPIEVKVLPVKD